MITTTYRCDRCEAEQTTADELRQVAVFCRPLPGLIGRIPNPPEGAAPSLSERLEEVLREIAREEIEAAR